MGVLVSGVQGLESIRGVLISVVLQFAFLNLVQDSILLPIMAM